MIKITAKQIRALREKTGAPMYRVKKVLEELEGNENKAETILKKEGFEKAATKLDRQTNAGEIAVYVHHSGKVASVVEVYCETDFVARNKLFRELAHNLALQVAAMDPKNVDELMEQEFIKPSVLQAPLVKDSTKKVEDLVKEVIAKTGENVRIGRIIRVELGQE